MPPADAAAASLEIPNFKHSAQAFDDAKDNILHVESSRLSSKCLTRRCVYTLTLRSCVLPSHPLWRTIDTEIVAPDLVC